MDCCTSSCVGSNLGHQTLFHGARGCLCGKAERQSLRRVLKLKTFCETDVATILLQVSRIIPSLFLRKRADGIEQRFLLQFTAVLMMFHALASYGLRHFRRLIIAVLIRSFIVPSGWFKAA